MQYFRKINKYCCFILRNFLVVTFLTILLFFSNRKISLKKQETYAAHIHKEINNKTHSINVS